ncbi:hypothetical protein D3C81_2022290 [compost metagenome]
MIEIRPPAANADDPAHVALFPAPAADKLGQLQQRYRRLLHRIVVAGQRHFMTDRLLPLMAVRVDRRVVHAVGQSPQHFAVDAPALP